MTPKKELFMSQVEGEIARREEKLIRRDGLKQIWILKTGQLSFLEKLVGLLFLPIGILWAFLTLAIGLSLGSTLWFLKKLRSRS
jgi:hypothetical protein